MSLREYQRERRKISSRNAWEPDFYKIVVEGKSSYIAFPDDEAKAYYVRCLENMLYQLPINIVAYSVVTNKAYFVVASWDQTPISLRRGFVSAATKYSRYYNQYYLDIGYAFRDRIYIKKISKKDNIFEDIRNVHAQPAIQGLSRGYSDYQFSSYHDTDQIGIISLKAVFDVFGREQAVREYDKAHLVSPTEVSETLSGFSEKDNFGYNLEEILTRYGCYDTKKIPPEIIPNIIIDLNEKGSYTFAYILSELMIKRKHSYGSLVAVASELILKGGKSYDKVLAMLDVPSSCALLKDIIIDINEQKFYSYKIIMGKMGLSYPSVEFLASLVEYYTKKRGLTTAKVLDKLGVYQKEIIDEVVAILG